MDSDRTPSEPQQDADPPPELVDDFAAYLDLVAISHGKPVTGGTTRAAGRQRLAVWLSLAMGLSLALVVVALLFARSTSTPGSTAPVPPPPAPVAEAGQPAQPAAVPAEPTSTESTEEAPPSIESTTTADCVVAPSTIDVSLANVGEQESTFTTGLLMQVWDVEFTNTTDASLTVAVHYTGTMGDKTTSDEWMLRSIGPGRTEHEGGSRDLSLNGKPVFNPVTTIPDRMVVMQERRVCLALAEDPKTLEQAVDVEAPRAPITD